MNDVEMKAEGEKGRFLGCLIGLAAGDAVGTTLEFRAPGSFAPIADMVGGGPFGLRAGEWTDDTAMAMCLAESLVRCGGFDALDQMERYRKWWREGYWSVREDCFDIGVTVRGALERFEATGNPWAGATAADTAGNGPLMRLAPAALFFRRDGGRALHFCGESSRTTHGARACVDGCRYFGGLLVGAVAGLGKEILLGKGFCPVPGGFGESPLAPEIAEIADGSFRRRNPPEIRGTGYVVRSLEAALWAFDRTENFRDAVLAAANLGEDADTTAAICGQLAGAHYGLEGIPPEWVERLACREKIFGLAEELWIKSCK